MKYLNRFKSKESIEAVQYTVANLNDIIYFVGGDNVRWNCCSEELWIETSLGDRLVRKGDYVVKKSNKKPYPMSSNMFTKLYRKSNKPIITVEHCQILH